MAKPALKAVTPDDPTTNALIDQHSAIIDAPLERRLAIVELTTAKIDLVPGTGDQHATMRIVHIELMHGADQAEAEKLMTRVHFDRTGNKTRPNPGETPPKLGEQLSGLEDVDDTVE